jgi:hypothetical protein
VIQPVRAATRICQGCRATADIRGLEVAVDHPALMGVVDGIGDLAEQPEAIVQLVMCRNSIVG